MEVIIDLDKGKFGGVVGTQLYWIGLGRTGRKGIGDSKYKQLLSLLEKRSKEMQTSWEGKWG